jgi:HD-GYP domain-containing protein (c-di-GMP phosphodiesterase class II)
VREHPVLTADSLTMPMRVLAVADVYEALTSERPYRRAVSSPDSLEIMRSEVPHRLDGDAFAVVEGLVADGAELTPAVDDAFRAAAVLGPR